jgi:hypothetical protein
VGGRGKRFALVEWCYALACTRVLSRRLGGKKVLEKNSPEKNFSELHHCNAREQQQQQQQQQQQRAPFFQNGEW